MSSGSETITTIRTYDNRRGAQHRIGHPPVVHIARGFESHLPFLSAGRPLIVLADWQYEPATQRHFWEQAIRALRDELGAEALSRSVVLVAGDMASAGDSLRGVKSDAAPELDWLRESFPAGDVLIVYGNHDLGAPEHLTWRNPASGLPCMLPHGGALALPLGGATEEATASDADPGPSAGTALATGAADAAADAAALAAAVAAEPQHEPRVPTAEQLAGLGKRERAALWAACSFAPRPSTTKQERRQRQHAAQRPDEALLAERLRALHCGAAAAAGGVGGRGGGAPLVVGAVHGIPASHTQGLRKLEREHYFHALDAACAARLDVLVTHANAKLQEVEQTPEVRGEDAPRLHRAFLRSAARLHVHGHMHTEPAVAVVALGKVVVCADARVVAFAPPPVAAAAEPEVAVSQ